MYTIMILYYSILVSCNSIAQCS